LEAGRLLESLDIASTEPVEVQERVIKAAAMTGLLSLALNLMDSLLSANSLPSDITQDALCSNLRRAGKLSSLEDILLRMGRLALEHSSTISVASFNIYLAALCDIVTEKDVTPKRDNTSRADLLRRAADWLQSNRATAELGVTPDSVSFATVLHAAAAVGNRTMTDMLWEELRSRNIQPSIVAYNARLRIANRRGSADKKVLSVWDEIVGDPKIKPDRYTIDLVVLPLIRAGRVGDVEDLLDRFVTSNSEKVVSNGFAAFLLTIVRGGELSTARALFDMYMLPALSRLMIGDVGSMRLVIPTARHLNILIEGYRSCLESPYSSKQDYERNVVGQGTTAFQEGWKLYDMMLQSPSIQPDSYTMTSMMGLCSSSSELTELLGQATNELSIECSSAVLRAAVTAYGDLGDPSSACWIFAKFSSQSAKIRNWNVLLGSFAKGAELNNTLVLDIASANATKTMNADGFAVPQHPLFKLLNGLTCSEAANVLLNHMNAERQETFLKLPKPNSQTYCVAAAALQYDAAGSEQAIEIFRSATASGISADGRFINAIFRCFGDNIDAALKAWKNEIRGACLAHEKRPRSAPPSIHRTQGKNLIAAYNGLLYVCGRAVRPDIALRVVYAMNKEGVEPNEVSLNCYRSGKRVRGNVGSRLVQRLRLVDPYESLLFVECTKYDENDKRRAGEKRVRIIV